MLEVTEKATAFLWESQSNRPSGGMTYRLVERPGGFGLAFDTLTPEDRIFTREGRDVLGVSPATAECASDLVIDLEETPEGHGLSFSVRR